MMGPVLLLGGLMALGGRLGIAVVRHYSHRSIEPMALRYQRAVGISFLVMTFGVLMVIVGIIGRLVS